MFWGIDKNSIDHNSCLEAFRQFRGIYPTGKKLFFKIVTNNQGLHGLAVVTQDQLSWFQCNTLSRICEVATEVLKGAKGDVLPGIEQLQTRVMHYGLKHGTTREMATFLQEADRVLHPPPGIFQSLKRISWPFGRSKVADSAVFYPSTGAQPSLQAPAAAEKQQGSVLMQKLCSSVNWISGLYPQKLAMMMKILQGKPNTGSLQYVQFDAPSSASLLKLSAEVGHRPMVVKSHKRGYDYRADTKSFTCTVNFADFLLFGYWKSPLFAQDEIQVVEHPALAWLQQYLSRWGGSPRTESLSGVPTPWLIKGVPRHGVVKGMYGNALTQVTPQQASTYISRLSQLKESNILAMAAINHGHGTIGLKYEFSHILKQFLAAYTAFKGAKQEAIKQGKPLTIQTGNWGTGAFGNDPELMAILQILAARFAGVDRLDYYTYDSAGQRAFNRAQKFVKQLDRLRDVGVTPTLGSILRVIHQANFRIGQSNGT